MEPKTTIVYLNLKFLSVCTISIWKLIFFYSRYKHLFKLIRFFFLKFLNLLTNVSLIN